MSLRYAISCLLLLCLLGTVTAATDKSTARIEKLGDIVAQDIIIAPSLVAADTCFVSDNGVNVSRVDGWVIGYELFKSLLDPEVSCENPYPFTITGINMPMMFDAGTPLTISVDVEAVDETTLPGCPIPGVLLAISAEWELTVPAGGGFFNIWVPLDTPLVVNEPFFAGFYLGSTIDPSVNAALVIDTIPVPCATYNIWDATIGWVDLVNNDYYNFPGRLRMEASGVPGGTAGAGDTLQLAMLFPANGDVLMGSTELWVFDSAMTGSIEYVSFEYSSGGAYVEINRDFDGSSPLRNGIDIATPGTGFGLNWDFSFLTEGNYTIRATAVDTAGKSSSVSVNVFLEPTPPNPIFTTPAMGEPFCIPLDMQLTTNDENLSFIELYHRPAQTLYSSGLTPLSQFAVGDDNGNPTDGNRVSGGEYGDYYSAPTAASMAIKLWFDRGYTNIMKEGSGMMSLEETAESLAGSFHTRKNLGNYDETVYAGLINYNQVHGSDLDFDMMRNPSYFDVRTWVEDEERSVIMGLSGHPGLWVAVDGFFSWIDGNGYYRLMVANPATGGIQVMFWRPQNGYGEIDAGFGWQKVDIMISMMARGWNVSRQLISVDFNGADGWSHLWEPTGLIDGSVSIFRAVGRDATGYRGSSVTMGKYDCASVYVAGDYNGDRVTDISDLFLLIDFIGRGNVPPNGGASRADCNCDSVVNIADIVYYMNYLFGAASPPCR